MIRNHSVIFEIATKYHILDSFVDYEGYSISSKGFLATVVDIIVIWVKFTHSSPFYFTDSSNVNVHSCYLLFNRFQFTLIHGPNIPGSYAILFFTALDFTSITSHIHSWALFLLWLCLFTLSEVISTLFYSRYWASTDLWSSSFSVLAFCLFILFMGFSRQEYWSGLPFPSPVGCDLSELSTMTYPSWVALHSMAHSFIKLEKAVVHVISLVHQSASVTVVLIPSTLQWTRKRGLGNPWKLPNGRE